MSSLARPETGSKPKGIFLWTYYRSTGTAFGFAIRTLPRVKVFNEPYIVPYYTTNPIKAIKGFNKINSTLTIQDATDMLQPDLNTGKDAVFAKAIASNLTGRFDILLQEGIKDFAHSFLIRDPHKVVWSWYKTSQDFETFLEYHERGDFGFIQLQELYHYLKKHLKIDPVVIDSDDLLDNPEGMMKAYCERVGLTYKEGMTKWEPGSMGDREFIDQKMGMTDFNWTEAAIKSSGLKKPPPSSLPPDLPPVVMEAIEEGMAPYNDLYKQRLIL